MGDVVQFPAGQRHRADRHFGGCPYCGGMDGQVDVGRLSWCVCQRHKVRWCIGSGNEDSPNNWKYKIRRLLPFREVTPIFPDDDQVG
jgi:hypothetical protein